MDMAEDLRLFKILCLRCTELLRSEPGLFLEQAGEVLRVLEAEGIGYLTDGVVGRGEAVTGLLDEVLLDELLRTVARLGFHEVTEVVG